MNLPLSEFVTLLNDTPFVVIPTSHYIEVKIVASCVLTLGRFEEAGSDDRP